MKTESGRSIVGAMLAAMLVSSAYADTIRCEKGLASVGDSKVSVLQKCGEPQYRDSYCRPVAVPIGIVVPDARARYGTTVVYNNVYGNTCVPVEEWTYVPAPGQFMNTLRFESGALISITSGDRVPR